MRTATTRRITRGMVATPEKPGSVTSGMHAWRTPLPYIPGSWGLLAVVRPRGEWNRPWEPSRHIAAG